MAIPPVSFCLCLVAMSWSGHLVPGAEKLLNEVHNAQPSKDGFWFRKLENMLRAAGQYRLEFELQPVMPGRGPLTISTSIHVSPGPAAALEVKARALSRCVLPEHPVRCCEWLCLQASGPSRMARQSPACAVKGKRPPTVCNSELQCELCALSGMHVLTAHALLVAPFGSGYARLLLYIP